MLPLVIPSLHTDRLLLRPHQLSDFEACTAMWADPEVARYTIGEPSPPQRTWMRILSYAGHWLHLGFGYWAVEDKANGKYIGELGFADFKRDMQPRIDGIPELGLALARHAHNRGYATEALRAVVEWGDRTFAQDRTVCIISPENSASLRVATKLGYQEYLQNELHGKTNLLFTRKKGG